MVLRKPFGKLATVKQDELSKAQCTCTTAAPNKAKKTPLTLMACTKNLVRVTVCSITRRKEQNMVGLYLQHQ